MLNLASGLVCPDQWLCSALSQHRMVTVWPGLSRSMQITQARPSPGLWRLVAVTDITPGTSLSPPETWYPLIRHHNNTLQTRESFEMIVSRVRFQMGSLEYNRTMHFRHWVKTHKCILDMIGKFGCLWSVIAHCVTRLSRARDNPTLGHTLTHKKMTRARL